MKRVITLGGLHGTGKSSVADLIAKEFNLRRTSAGTIFRQLAKEKGLTLEEFSRIAMKNPEIDRLLDETLKREAERGNVVIDGQLAAWMAGNLADFKILLTAPLSVRVQRIASRDERSYEDALQETIMREKIERDRYMDYYGIDITDLTIYDLILNTEKFNLGEVYAIVRLAIQHILTKE